jgi:hypothetical protein
VLRAQPFPDDWVCGLHETKEAYQLADWDADVVYAEFDKFRDWHKSKNIRSYDWLAEWRKWIRRGIEYQKTNKPQRLKGLASAVVGIKKAYERDKAYHRAKRAQANGDDGIHEQPPRSTH